MTRPSQQTGLTAAGPPVRTLIVTCGRSGSSLLAAIMADAGAEFGMPTPDRWDQGAGVMEHPLAIAAGWKYERAWQIRGGRRFFLGYKYLADARVGLAKRDLRRLLAEVDTVKGPRSDLWVPDLPKLGYVPNIVVPFAPPGEVARSFLMKAKQRWDDTRSDYLRANRNALLYLQSFGGCAVALRDLTDRESITWARALASATGLDVAALIEARNRRVTKAAIDRAPSGRPSAVDLGDLEVEAVHDALSAVRDRHVPASRQAFRRFGLSGQVSAG